MFNRCSIFLSYRRSDASGYVRALMSDLRHEFGGKQVFLDMETIEAGSDFVDTIERSVSECEVLLAIIGPSWLTVKDSHGQRRLDNPDDFNRIEIASAINQHIPVIPVLVDNAVMPSLEVLPPDLQGLASLQAVTLSHVNWDHDIRRLMSAIENFTEEPRLARQYSSAKQKLKAGYWLDALEEFDAIEAVNPEYENCREICGPLRELKQKLIESGPEAHKWQRIVLDNPAWVVALASLLPHFFAAAFNFIFNWQAIVLPMKMRGIEQADVVFRVYAGSVNGALFSLGLGLLVFLVRPVRLGLKQLDDTPEKMARLRKYCLNLGNVIALIGLGLWIFAGPVYPLLIGTLETREYVFFIISLAICGLTVAAYPFLMVTWIVTRVIYRPFMRQGTASNVDLMLLDKVVGWKWIYLITTVAVPMLVISLGFIIGLHHLPIDSIGRLLGIAGLVGLTGFLMALLLFKAIQADLELLRQVLRVSSPDNLA